MAHFLREESDTQAFFAPVNEINFFAWAAGRDLMYPYAYGRDWELKRQLVRAATVAAAAILDVEPRARLVYPEPMIHNVCKVAGYDVPETFPRLTYAQAMRSYGIDKPDLRLPPFHCVEDLFQGANLTPDGLPLVAIQIPRTGALTRSERDALKDFGKERGPLCRVLWSCALGARRFGNGSAQPSNGSIGKAR